MVYSTENQNGEKVWKRQDDDDKMMSELWKLMDLNGDGVVDAKETGEIFSMWNYFDEQGYGDDLHEVCS